MELLDELETAIVDFKKAHKIYEQDKASLEAEGRDWPGMLTTDIEAGQSWGRVQDLILALVKSWGYEVTEGPEIRRATLERQISALQSELVALDSTGEGIPF